MMHDLGKHEQEHMRGATIVGKRSHSQMWIRCTDLTGMVTVGDANGKAVWSISIAAMWVIEESSTHPHSQ